jgi:hypothetical protein
VSLFLIASTVREGNVRQILFSLLEEPTKLLRTTNTKAAGAAGFPGG